MAKVQPTFKGTRDIFGDDIRFRQQVIQVIRSVFVSFGFEELETPVIEREDTLLGKYGQEAQKLIFRLNPIHEGGLRYDHTVPLARFMAGVSKVLTLPYRRFAIGPVFRAENPQAGRFRQFVQCDFDTVGSNSPVVDAEIVAMNYRVLTQLGFTDQYTINLNDRRLLNALVVEMGITQHQELMAVFRAWDKLDKVQPQEAFEYLVNEFMDMSNTVSQSARTQIEQRLAQSYQPVTHQLLALQGKETNHVLQALARIFTLPQSQAAIQTLIQLVQLVDAMEVPQTQYEVNPLLARGLDYYTGPIFETVVKTAGIGSITGGGRYDELVESLGGPALPASGSSFGLERLLHVMEQLNLRPSNMSSTQIFVTVFDLTNPVVTKQTFHVASLLRENNIATEVYTGDAGKLSKQLTLANRKGVSLALIIGPDELQRGVINIKDLRPGGTQTTVSISQLVGTVKNLLGN